MDCWSSMSCWSSFRASKDEPVGERLGVEGERKHRAVLLPGGPGRVEGRLDGLATPQGGCCRKGQGGKVDFGAEGSGSGNWGEEQVAGRAGVLETKRSVGPNAEVGKVGEGRGVRRVGGPGAVVAVGAAVDERRRAGLR